MDWGEEGENEEEGRTTSGRISTGVLSGGSEEDGSGDNAAALGSPACDLLIVVSPQNIVGGRYERERKREKKRKCEVRVENFYLKKF